VRWKHLLEGDPAATSRSYDLYFTALLSAPLRLCASAFKK
jgi:hypothetical protein